MKIFWKTVTLMPKFIGHKLIRRNFKFSYELAPDLTFKVAETTDEIEQAFRIIHDGYVERNLIDENEAKLRITKYYCLPSTALLICKQKDEVIATITLIGDSAFGLPTEEFRDLSDYRARGMKLAEISGLAIKKNNQSKRGRLLLPLFKYMFEYAQKYMKAEGLVISTTAEVKEFYRALFFFKPLDNSKVMKFSTVKNRETISQILLVNETEENFRKHYAHLPPKKNIHHYFVQHQFEQFKFPKNYYPFTIRPVFGHKQMQHFFIERTSLLESLQEKEKIILAQHYPHEEFRKVILDKLEPKLLRENVRIPIHCSATLNGKMATVENVSDTGLKIHLTEAQALKDDIVTLSVYLTEELLVEVKAQVMWVYEKTAGLKILNTVDVWKKMIAEAHDLYLKDHEREVA